jgi:hypothetical protein
VSPTPLAAKDPSLAPTSRTPRGPSVDVNVSHVQVGFMHHEPGRGGPNATGNNPAGPGRRENLVSHLIRSESHDRTCQLAAWAECVPMDKCQLEGAGLTSPDRALKMSPRCTASRLIRRPTVPYN